MKKQKNKLSTKIIIIALCCGILLTLTFLYFAPTVHVTEILLYPK